MAKCLRRKGVNEKKITFNQIYKQYVKKEGLVSPALCFLTVLHLANEHNLILEGEVSHNDFKVYNEEINSVVEA